MTIYLTVITTALVATQIIRLLQNWQQLKRQGGLIEKHNELVLRVYRKWDRWLDRQGDDGK
jgi:hypothetical protein